MMMRCQRLTFAYVCDVEVEAADGEVGVLDLQRHCCLLFDAGLPRVCSAMDLSFGALPQFRWQEYVACNLVFSEDETRTKHWTGRNHRIHR